MMFLWDVYHYGLNRNLLKTHQSENESVSDYTKLFKTSRYAMELHIGGQIIMIKFVEKMADYESTYPDKIEEYNKSAFRKLLSLLYQENLYKNKYGSLLKRLSSQKSLGNDQYPKLITKTREVFS